MRNNVLLTKLHQVQSLIARKIIRAYKTVPFEASTVLADIIPIELSTRKRATLFAIKHFGLIFPDIHYGSTSHLSHSECLSDLSSSNDINPQEYSTQSYQCNQNPTTVTYPATIIKSHEQAVQIAINHHENDSDANPTFYTDGSKTSKGAGAAYCQIEHKSVVQSGQIRLQLNNTVFQAEAVALLECLLLIKTMDCIFTTIFSDYQSVSKAITPFSKDPIITEIQNIYTIISKSCRIAFYWRPGHVNIFGNECADRLAKSAVLNGRSASISVNLPISYAKLILQQNISKLWQTS